MDDRQFQQLIDDPAARTRDYREMVRAYYNRITDTYREKWSDSFHFAVFHGDEPLAEALLATEQALADEGGFRPGMRVLDIGCGVGGPALNIAEHSGAQVTGINIVEGQVEIARRRAVDRSLDELAQFRVMDAMQMDFADGSFDAIYIFEAGCHMPDKPRFYRDCARVLKPGGVFLGNEWLKKGGLTPAEEQRYIEPVCKYFGVPHLISLAELGRYVEEAGLTVEALEDVATQGNILRNWELVSSKAVQAVRSFLPFLIPPVQKLLIDSGVALCEAAKVGAFVIGHWRARKREAS